VPRARQARCARRGGRVDGRRPARPLRVRSDRTSSACGTLALALALPSPYPSPPTLTPSLPPLPSSLRWVHSERKAARRPLAYLNHATFNARRLVTEGIGAALIACALIACALIACASSLGASVPPSHRALAPYGN